MTVETVALTAEEKQWLLQKRLDDAGRKRTSGRYVLTPEGRAEVRNLWKGEDDHWIVTLLNEVESLEAELSRAKAAIRELVAEHDAWPGRDPLSDIGRLGRAWATARAIAET